MQAIKYYRNNKNWSKLVGKTGKVLASSLIHVSSPELSKFSPYSFMIVKIDSTKYELMSVAKEELNPGDLIKCVLRKSEITNQREVIGYTIKAKKIMISLHD